MMKKFNLFNEIIKVDKTDLTNAINTQKVFGITIDGKIVDANTKDILIYKAKAQITPTFTKALGNNYQLVEDGDKVLIKAFSNWQELIKINTPNASYDDTTADGVAEFSNKDLEDIGWHATEFNIKYRTLVEVLEKNCDGVVLCIEQEEPYQFSGLGFLTDNNEAKKVLFEYCQKEIKNKLENDEDFKIETLTDDEEDAAKFFKLI